MNSLEVLKPSTLKDIVVASCLICNYSFECNNITEVAYDCTYHLFCVGIQLDANKYACVSPGCGNVFAEK